MLPCPPPAACAPPCYYPPPPIPVAYCPPPCPQPYPVPVAVPVAVPVPVCQPCQPCCSPVCCPTKCCRPCCPPCPQNPCCRIIKCRRTCCQCQTCCVDPCCQPCCMQKCGKMTVRKKKGSKGCPCAPGTTCNCCGSSGMRVIRKIVCGMKKITVLEACKAECGQGQKGGDKGQNMGGDTADDCDVPPLDNNCGCCFANPCCCPCEEDENNGECNGEGGGADGKGGGAEDNRGSFGSGGSGGNKENPRPTTAPTGNDGNRRDSAGKGGRDSWGEDPLRNGLRNSQDNREYRDDGNGGGPYADIVDEERYGRRFGSDPPPPERQFAKAIRRLSEEQQSAYPVVRSGNTEMQKRLDPTIYRPYWYTDDELTTKSKAYLPENYPADLLNSNTNRAPIVRRSCVEFAADGERRKNGDDPANAKPTKTRWLQEPRGGQGNPIPPPRSRPPSFPEDDDQQPHFSKDDPRAQIPSVPQEDFTTPVNEFATVPKGFKDEWSNLTKAKPGDGLPVPDKSYFEYDHEVGDMLRTTAEARKKAKRNKSKEDPASTSKATANLNERGEDDDDCCFKYNSRRLRRLCSMSKMRKRRLSQVQQPFCLFQKPACPIRETVASILRKVPQTAAKGRVEPEFHEYCMTDHKRDVNRHKLLTRQPSGNAMPSASGIENRGAKRTNQQR